MWVIMFIAHILAICGFPCLSIHWYRDFKGDMCLLNCMEQNEVQHNRAECLSSAHPKRICGLILTP